MNTESTTGHIPWDNLIDYTFFTRNQDHDSNVDYFPVLRTSSTSATT